MSTVASSSKVLAAPAHSPAPSYILRGHAAQISALAFSLDARLLNSGDVDGFVAVWSLAIFRPLLFFRAHEAGILTIESYAQGVLTHGRDNKIHYYPLPSLPPDIARVGAAAAVPSPSKPSRWIEPVWSLDVNALAFSKMSVCQIPSTHRAEPDAAATWKGKEKEQALVAVPSLTRDELVDIFHVPSHGRVHRSIGSDAFAIGEKTGTIMALQLFVPATGTLHLLVGYEAGTVALFRFTDNAQAAFHPLTLGQRKEEGEGWQLVWTHQGHRETVIGLGLTPDLKYAWSCGADHHLAKYSLGEAFPSPPATASNAGKADSPDDEPTHMRRIETAYPGRSALAIRDDGKLLAVTGWDGETRLYSARTGKALAVLSYHRSSLQAVAFAPLRSGSGVAVATPSKGSEAESDSDEDEDEDGGGGRRAWLAVGGSDERISLWEVYPP